VKKFDPSFFLSFFFHFFFLFLRGIASLAGFTEGNWIIPSFFFHFFFPSPLEAIDRSDADRCGYGLTAVGFSIRRFNPIPHAGLLPLAYANIATLPGPRRSLPLACLLWTATRILSASTAAAAAVLKGLGCHWGLSSRGGCGEHGGRPRVPRHYRRGLGFRVKGLGSRVQGSGFRV